MRYLVEMDNGGSPYWLADWRGDPGRTVVKESARRYATKDAANNALKMAQKLYGDYRPSLLIGRIIRAAHPAHPAPTAPEVTEEAGA